MTYNLSNKEAKVRVRKELNEPMLVYAAGKTSFHISFMFYIIMRFGNIAKECDRLKEVKSLDKFHFKIGIRELIKFLNNYEKYNKEYKEKLMIKATQEILSVIYIDNNETFIDGWQLVGKTQYDKEKETLDFWINPYMLEFFTNLEKAGNYYYTEINFNEQKSLKSKYAKILFIILNQDFYKQSLTIKIENFKKAIGKENIKNAELKRTIIMPAVAEIKKLDRFITLRYEYNYKNKPIGQKGGKMIDSITFEWNHKQLEIFEAPNYAEIEIGNNVKSFHN